MNIERTIKTVDYFHNTELYTCIENSVNFKKIEEYYTPIGRLKIEKIKNISSIYVYCGDFSYEYENISDNKTKYTRFCFTELKQRNKERTIEYMIYSNIKDNYISKTLTLNNKLRIRKLHDMLYYVIT